MSEIIPFITLKDCLKAIEYYKEVLDAKLVGEMTMMNNIKGYEKDIYKDMVGHATLSIGGSKIFLNDYSDDNLQKMGNNIQFVLNLEMHFVTLLNWVYTSCQLDLRDMETKKELKL